MKNQGLTKFAFNTLDRITDVFPSFGPKVFQKIFISIFGSSLIYNYNFRRYQKKLAAIKDFGKILIVGDVNIGDSLISQSCVVLVKAFFPDSQVDFICHKIGGKLIYKSPIADNVFNVYKKSGLPSEEDVEQIKEITKNGTYTLILDFSPFLNKVVFNCSANVIHLYIPFANYILNLWKNNSSNLNMSYAKYIFTQKFFEPLLKSNIHASGNGGEFRLNTTYSGNKIFISHEAIEAAKEFLVMNNLYPAHHLLLFNPFVTSKFSMIPIALQIAVLKDVLLSDDIKAILIYEGTTEFNLDTMILEKLPVSLTGKIVKIPNTMSIEVYAALVDFCDMFFSGDTGTVHMSASRKIPLNPNDSLRNRTAVVSVFGASDSRMYNYDSYRYGHATANQDVPSKVFVGAAPCRTITCINRLVKTCREVRCFEGLKASDMSEYIINYFHNLKYSGSFQEEFKIYANGSGGNGQ